MVSVGDTLQGRYRILRLIGEGAMGAVYEGEHLLIHRRVAIKVLHAYARTQEAAARFEREAQASGQIESDHITEVLDLGRLDDGDHFIVMEFLSGETLGARYQRLGRLAPEQVVPLVRQVLVGLAAAHAAGIVHRDIKPENLFVLPHKAGQRDFVKILDFGVSKFREKNDKGSLALTGAGSMMGTPCYMSPEQARGQGDAGVSTDLYAVGVVLYEGLTGEVPFDGNNLNELLFKIVEGRFIAPRQRVPTLDATLDALVCKALAYSPDQRFQSADELIDALDGWTRARLAVRAARARSLAPSADAGVASTSPMEHSITLPRLGPGGRRGGWATLLGVVLCGASVLVYRSRSTPGASSSVVEATRSVASAPAPEAAPSLEPVDDIEPAAMPAPVTSGPPARAGTEQRDREATQRGSAAERSSAAKGSSAAEPSAPRRAPGKSSKARASRARAGSQEAAAAKSRSERETREREASPAVPEQRLPPPPRSVKVRPDWGY
jgi:serine/threonine protein kinase